MAEDDGEAPRPLAEKPAVPAHLALVWQAFWDLAGDRHQGMGRSGPIPFSAVDRWAARYGFEGDDFEELHALLKAMDAEFLSWEPPKEPGKD